MMLTNTDKIKDNSATSLHVIPTSGSMCLPDGNKIKNSHLKLTSK